MHTLIQRHLVQFQAALLENVAIPLRLLIYLAQDIIVRHQEQPHILLGQVAAMLMELAEQRQVYIHVRLERSMQKEPDHGVLMAAIL